MGLNEQEREEWTSRFIEELEAEHASRLRSLERRRAKSRNHHERRRAQGREAELSLMKDELRENFYKDRGYKLYIDSTGREKWVTPEEYEWLMQRRRRRGKKAIYRPQNVRARTIALYIGMAGFAVVLGLLLVRSI